MLWTNIFLMIKTRDKIKCSQKVSCGPRGRGQFSWGKINPGKCPLGKLPSGNLPPIPQRKKKRKKKKIDSRKSYLLGKM